MDAASLRELQAPLKARYREQPDAAHVRLHAEGSIDVDAIACRLDTGRALVEAGLHPATGGSGLQACSGDMLLEALVACAGVTLRAGATALEFRLKGACQPAGKTACRTRPPSPTITGEGRGLSGPAPGGIGNERSLPAKRHLYGAVPQS